MSVGLFLFSSQFVAESKGQTIKKIVVHETTLRKKSTKKVVPKYPEEAIKANSFGVAVSEITISEVGDVINVKILESPHESIGDSMVKALKQWKFFPFTFKGKPQKITGKITYYFLIENNQAKVESPY